MTTDFSVRRDSAGGLLFSWGMLRDVSLRVLVRGANVFRVWNVVDSGETAPVWAEPDLALTLFGPDSETDITEGPSGIMLTSRHARVVARVNLALVDDALECRLAIDCPSNARALPLCLAELQLNGITLAPDAVYTSAHSYGGRTFNHGQLTNLETPGVVFAQGCIGLGLPLVYLHEPTAQRGVEFEFLVPDRPAVWLRPAAVPGQVDWAIQWTTDRLVSPGQTHAYGGAVRLREFAGRPVEQLRHWRDAAATRFGLAAKPAPDWARRMNIIEFNMNPANTAKGFTRLDDPQCRAMLQRWRAMGYNAIFCVSQFRCGGGWLSPFSYDACEAVGGAAAEQQFLRWARELGFHPFLWVTTVGIDRAAPEVAAHPEWFTHRGNNELFYAWDSTPQNGYVGYAPDGDPLATGWRNWLKDQVSSVIRRGYSGVFVDGCIPRASNHARWAWPGEGRNGVEDQVAELAGHVRRIGPDLITFVEDESPLLQAQCEVTQGRYTPMPPFFQRAFHDHGMGGGGVTPPQRIPPELAREYLLLRYASQLPHLVSSDVVEGYYSESHRPWVMQSLLAGCVPKTHSESVDDPLTYRAWGDAGEAAAADRTPERRQRGYEEFLEVLQFCAAEPLIREAPLSIEGVVIEGSRAVVGFLRPTPGRCVLALINFAGRDATVRVRLAQPVDMPGPRQNAAGQSHAQPWNVRERLRSRVDLAAQPPGRLAAGGDLLVTLAAHGFRVFELLANSGVQGTGRG